MRTISTDEQAIIDGSGRSEWCTVQVADATAAFQSLHTAAGFNCVHSVEWSESIDDVGQTATITLIREQHGFSIAPLMTTAPVNVGFVVGGSYSPLIAVAREIKILTLIQPADTSIGSGTTLFHGVIDSIDVASDDKVVLTCRDLAAKIADTYLEEEYVFAFGADGGNTVRMRIWDPNTAFALNEYMLPTEANRAVTGKFFKCTTAGTTGNTEPVWNSAGTTTSGTAVFTAIAATSDAGFSMQTVIQRMLDVMTSPPTLNIPVSPSFNMKPWKQARTGLLSAVRAVVAQRGWDVRYKWDSGSSTFKFTLYEPDRAAVSPVQTFGADDYVEIGGAVTDISGVRNAVQIVYSDSGDLDAKNVPKRKKVLRTDSTSITTYGRRFMEIAEDDASQIDTASEANAMGDAVVADLKDPKVAMQVRLVHGFPWVELGDLYRFSANGRHFDTDQDLAVYQYRHKCANGKMQTELSLRGKPAARYDAWHRIDARAKVDGAHSLRLFQSGDGLTVSTAPVVGGTRIDVSRVLEKRVPLNELLDFHVSTSAGFTPSSSTLKVAGASRAVTLGELKPGAVYYGQVVPSSLNEGRPVIGQPSSEFSFTAGRASAGHAEAAVAWGRAPLNGGFETRLDAAGAPDHWEVTAGVWGTEFDLVTGSGAISGDAYLRMKTSSSTSQTITSDPFQVEAGVVYTIDWWSKNVSGTETYFVDLEWLNSALGSVSTSSITQVPTVDTGNWNHWPMDSGSGTLIAGSGTGAGPYILAAPSTAKYARVKFRKAATSNTIEVHFDSVRVRRLEPIGLLPFGAAVAANVASTEYVKPGGPALNTSTNEVSWRAPVTCIVYGVWGGSRVAPNSLRHVYTVRLNSADTSHVATQNSGNTGFNDTSQPFFVAQNERIALKIVTVDTGEVGADTGALDTTITLGLWV